MRHTLADHVRSYLADDEVALHPQDPTHEARVNTYWFDVGAAKPAEVRAVVDALRAVAAGLRERLRDSPIHGSFYAWYDDQAGQLRCSLTSQDRLPFGADVRPLNDPSPIVEVALNDPSPGQVSLHDPTDVPDALEESAPSPLDVWISQV